MRTSVRAAVIAVGLLALAGCGDPEPTGSTSTTPSASETSASPTPSESPSPSSSPSATGRPYALDEVASASFPEGGGPPGTRGAVRVGTHERYDRVVWEFDGPGPLSFRVRPVDEPIGDGSGDPVEVAGDAYLEVLVTGLEIPASLDDCPGDASAASLKNTVVAQANSFCGGFEGVGQVFVGLDRERPFRVTTLTNPTRLVVDVSTD
ncbi:hypothetical protein [Oryzobacter telluris]|uniref:AMIN-like domain-containing (lipo)protein n=1 Tax=Oryzobacter telluris TaxID=3149179 RepID=UPI00370D2FD4